MNDLTETLKFPMIYLRAVITLPDNIASIDVGRKKSLKAVEVANGYEKTIFISAQKNINVEDPTIEDVYKVGVIARIKESVNLVNGGKRVICTVLKRAELLFIEEGEFDVAEVKVKDFVEEENTETEVLYEMVKKEYETFTSIQKKKDARMEFMKNIADKGNVYVNKMSAVIPFSVDKMQNLLEADFLNDRLTILYTQLKQINDFVEVEKRIAEKVRQSMDKSQKEYYLREQLKAIHNELGDDESEIEKLTEQIKAKNMPKDTEEKVLKELSKMSRMNPSSPDYTVIRGYIDWILDLPFTSSENDSDLQTAKEILEKEHYGLQKVKDRILEYLAVYKLTGKLNGPILCLVGPPGVGKTSIAGSVARAIGREFVRMSLGGVKDEAEIRGHRKTYIGAMPGRIIFGLKEAKSNNPVFLLDEIDKISSDLRGDPASALLEVLDPEQNATFRDRYLEIPYDLSKVMFITTANSLETIPGPLLDRMEVLPISGYTYQEKEEIAKRYLIPKQSEKNGITEKNIEFTDEGIKFVIDGYTKEAGVRNLERQIATLCRKVATEYALNKKARKKKIDKKAVEKYLGGVKFIPEEKNEKAEVGVTTGLAWTQVGGTTLCIEATLMEGKGNLILTGKLGEVMQESAKTAFDYIRANAKKLGIDANIFEKNDVHIHVPEGATPKDGPSAGITMATTILSALTGKAVRCDLAMTGEITLSGRVLAIGGLKEKSLAAYSIGIRDIIIPKANEKDLEEIPSEILSEIRFYPVKRVEEVFEKAFVK